MIKAGGGIVPPSAFFSAVQPPHSEVRMSIDHDEIMRRVVAISPVWSATPAPAMRPVR